MGAGGSWQGTEILTLMGSPSLISLVQDKGSSRALHGDHGGFYHYCFKLRVMIAMNDMLGLDTESFFFFRPSSFFLLSQSQYSFSSHFLPTVVRLNHPLHPRYRSDFVCDISKIVHRELNCLQFNCNYFL